MTLRHLPTDDSLPDETREFLKLNLGKLELEFDGIMVSANYLADDGDDIFTGWDEYRVTQSTPDSVSIIKDVGGKFTFYFEGRCIYQVVKPAGYREYFCRPV